MYNNHRRGGRFPCAPWGKSSPETWVMARAATCVLGAIIPVGDAPTNSTEARAKTRPSRRGVKAEQFALLCSSTLVCSLQRGQTRTNTLK